VFEKHVLHLLLSNYIELLFISIYPLNIIQRLRQRYESKSILDQTHDACLRFKTDSTTANFTLRLTSKLFILFFKFLGCIFGN